MKYLFYIIICLFCLSVQAQTKVEPTWESLQQRGYPQWFSDAKLGIFIHWGLTSIPAWAGKEQYSEWFLLGIIRGEAGRTNFMERVYGKDFKYEDFNNLFKAELFDPDEWADIFERSGAKYALLVTKHHDGYCLWNSKYAPNWNTVTGGPKRDIVGELTKSVRDKGLKMGFYYSLAEWNNPLHRWYTDPDDSISRYVDQHMIPQFKELVEAYKPSLIFTDGEWSNSAKQWHAAELISWYYNLVGDEAIVNDRWGHGSNHGYRTPEYSAGITQTDRPWAECRGLGRSFGLNRNEPIENYLTNDELIRHFAKLVASGGGMTLNVGPAADGKIPLLQQERLLALGDWLKVNGEAIYGSRPYKKFTEEKEVEVKRIDPEINFNWVRNSPDRRISVDRFNAEWTGFIQPEYSETYTFEARSDDGIRVWVDGKLLIDRWQKFVEGSESNVEEHAENKSVTNTVKMQAGKRYVIKVEYFEDVLNASVSLFWQSESQRREVIPTRAFYTSGDKSAQQGLNAVYRSMMPYLCYTTNNDALYAIALEWTTDKLELDVERPVANTKITLIGRDGNLPWEYKNNRLIVDLSGVKFWEMPCKSAWVLKIK